MADFCKQCSIELFGQDHGDLTRLMDEDAYNLTSGAFALCEGCGPTTVDYEGQCRSIGCNKHGEANKRFFADNGVDIKEA